MSHLLLISFWFGVSECLFCRLIHCRGSTIRTLWIWLDTVKKMNLLIGWWSSNMLQMEPFSNICTVKTFWCSLGLTLSVNNGFRLSDKEMEHLDWSARMRIIMGTAYCLQHMHEMNPPMAHSDFNSSEIYLTDDYAAKVCSRTSETVSKVSFLRR